MDLQDPKLRLEEQIALEGNSPGDSGIRKRSQWWKETHALAVMGVLTSALLLAGSWILVLRRRVKYWASKLKTEIEGHNLTEAILEDKAALLAAEIGESERMANEVERAHKDLITASRQAGMAEVAISVLHNVGNALNSVNVSLTILVENIKHSKSAVLPKLADLLANSAHEPAFLTTDEKGRQIPGFLSELGKRLDQEQQDNLKELKQMRDGIEHITGIVAMQQDYARLQGVAEKAKVSEMVEDAIRLNLGALTQHKVMVLRDYQADPESYFEKHKVLQVLVQLIQNAERACSDSEREDRQLILRIHQPDEKHVHIQAIDNGIGIPGENLDKLFGQGFTTRKDGHGFGLHGSSIAAKEMHGSLTVHSDGHDKGATFTLELPLQADAEQDLEE